MFHTTSKTGEVYLHKNLGYVNGRWGLLKEKIQQFVEEHPIVQDDEKIGILEIPHGQSPCYSGHTFVYGVLKEGAEIPEEFSRFAETFWGYVK